MYTQNFEQDAFLTNQALTNKTQAFFNEEQHYRYLDIFYVENCSVLCFRVILIVNSFNFVEKTSN